MCPTYYSEKPLLNMVPRRLIFFPKRKSSDFSIVPHHERSRIKKVGCRPWWDEVRVEVDRQIYLHICRRQGQAPKAEAATCILI
ncbi:hypothetical protein PVAP13_4NG106219 [Panicum virgatum]|uniref:Uncharacterized protein n=1 Tax=Panicum virgatum TaxID=38727 RepID=A0A8T0TAX9_PANVG|nr:hypothetical protein PVAP13_4NG106219 [Panicum virgatum]